MQASITPSQLPRALRKLTAAAAPAPAQPAGPRRQLQQFAGTGNFMVGAAVESWQRATYAAGVAAQLLNFYGTEGVGMRHRLGALPSPGGLEMLLLAGPNSLPTPRGMVAGGEDVVSDSRCIVLVAPAQHCSAGCRRCCACTGWQCSQTNDPSHCCSHCSLPCL